MKKLSPFLAGMATMALIGSLTFSALAASGSFTITVDPINIQVNGTTFQPKDAQGKDVPVFTYNGTTYAPLRALAEAYGLEVGYDAKANMATVGEASTDTPTTPDSTALADYSNWSAEDEAAYQEFKGMWTVEYQGVDTSLGQHRDSYWFSPNDANADAIEKLNLIPYDKLDKYAERLLREYHKEIGVVIAFMDTEGSWSGYGISIYESGGLWLGHK